MLSAFFFSLHTSFPPYLRGALLFIYKIWHWGEENVCLFAMIDGAIYSQNYALLFTEFKCLYKKKGDSGKIDAIMYAHHTHSAHAFVSLENVKSKLEK